ncbi:MAG: hypothetical protein OXG37_16200 [Actinomycetia bacterium]|nr:hypothetical protein [Actinomycetes bacterium]
MTKPIPTVPLRRLLLNPHFRDGNLPAMFADAGEQYGPVFEIRLPLSKTLLIFLAGSKPNHWAHREGRMHLRAGENLQDFKKVYGASGICPLLMVPIIFGFGRRCSQSNIDQDWKVS